MIIKFVIELVKSVFQGVACAIIAMTYMSVYTYIQTIHPEHALTITVMLFICLGIYFIISLMIDNQPKRLKLSSKIMRVLPIFQVFLDMSAGGVGTENQPS